ncbi:hypothetical protein NC652_013936 [Populus alba x Populus x berolinensis]|nr:hypothetical protein NC652_013936 [Populus alba x Populus x berolinensis]
MVSITTTTSTSSFSFTIATIVLVLAESSGTTCVSQSNSKPFFSAKNNHGTNIG